MTRTNWVFIFAFLVGLTATIMIFRPSVKKQPKTQTPSPELLAGLADEEKDDEERLARIYVPEPETFVEGDGPYQEGYKVGYSSFKAQNFGFSVPAVAYTSSGTEDSFRESEEYGKGYIDGYHKATEVMSCAGKCPY